MVSDDRSESISLAAALFAMFRPDEFTTPERRPNFRIGAHLSDGMTAAIWITFG
jgi:hypothetical protein